MKLTLFFKILWCSEISNQFNWTDKEYKRNIYLKMTKKPIKNENMKEFSKYSIYKIIRIKQTSNIQKILGQWGKFHL